MGWLKSVFGMPKIVDAIINTGDKVVFSEEEKKDWIVTSAKVLGPQNVARRGLAFGVTFVWLVFTLTNAGLIIWDHTQQDAFQVLYTQVFYVFSGVMAFYFGTHLLRAKNGNSA